MTKDKILKSKYYKYPSFEERERLNNKVTKYKRFNFKSNSIFNSIQDGVTLENINKNENLYNWNISLSNRLGKLTETHLYIITHFERGFFDNYLECNERELVDRALFDYFVEIFYYYFYSAIENIAQILNLYFDINTVETKIHFNNLFIDKIENNSLKKKLKSFLKSINNANYIRHSFTHRFPINQKDFRTKISKNNNSTVLSKGSGKIISTKAALDKINESTASLNKLIVNLNSFFEKDQNLSSTISK